MDPIQDLLKEIQKIQCLVCAARHGSDGEGMLPTRELLEVLRISPGECGRVIGTLAAEGLFEPVPDPAHPLPRAIRLTETGRSYLRDWNASVAGQRALDHAPARRRSPAVGRPF